MTTSANTANRRAFWDRHPGLVWSNRGAPNEAFISAALQSGRFLLLVEIAVEFGIGRMEEVWKSELSCGDLPDSTIHRTESVLEILRKANERIAASSHREPVAPAC